MPRVGALNDAFVEDFVVWLYRFQYCQLRHISNLAGIARYPTDNDLKNFGDFLERVSVPGYQWPFIRLSLSGRQYARTLDPDMPKLKLFHGHTVEPITLPHELYLREIISRHENGLEATSEACMHSSGYFRIPDALIGEVALEFERTAKSRSRTMLIFQKCSKTMQMFDIDEWHWYFKSEKVFRSYTRWFSEEIWPLYQATDRGPWMRRDKDLQPTDRYKSRFKFYLLDEDYNVQKHL